MGLDMYLRAKLFCWSTYADESVDLKVNGNRVYEVSVELAYWRKHPDLHGYIVDTFAAGVDDCRPIELTRDQLLQILAASEAGELKHGTTGFFFGTSIPADREHTKTQIEAAIAWIDAIAAERTVSLNPLTAIGPFMMAEVVLPPEHEPEVKAKPKQKFSVESVFYEASW